MRMFRYGISCALEPLPTSQPTVFRGSIEDVARSVSETGYDGIELFLRNPGQFAPTELRATASRYGLQYCAIATGMEYTLNRLCLIGEDCAARAAAVERLMRHLDLGAEIGCPVIVGIMRGNIPDSTRQSEYLEMLSDALVKLSRYAEQTGGSIVVEAILRYINNYLNSSTETADYLRSLGLKNIRLHLDTHSMLIEDKSLAQSILDTSDILGYMHFSDSNRGYPGAGNMDFKPVMAALRKIGYDGYITVESLPYPSETACAHRGIQYLNALEKALDIESSEK